MPRLRITLPKLLSTSPLTSKTPLLVQPAEWQTKFPNSFYKITRTKLRTVPIPIAAAPTPSSSKSGAAKGKAPEKVEPVGEEAEVKMRECGKAWGVLFWNGKPKYPFRKQYEINPTLFHSRISLYTSKFPDSPPLPPVPSHETYIPASLIRKSLTQSWALVDPSTLGEETRKLVEELKSGKRIDGEWGREEREKHGLGRGRKVALRERLRERRREREGVEKGEKEMGREMLAQGV